MIIMPVKEGENIEKAYTDAFLGAIRPEALPGIARNNKLVREMIFRRFPEELMFYSSLVDE